MLTPSENPPIIPPFVQSLTELHGSWWVGHTKSRFEKVFAWELTARGIGYFLPMTERITFSGGRKRKVMSPLFPSYVFFCGDSNARYQALTTNRLCQVLPVAEQANLVRELEQIQNVLVSGQPLDLYPEMPIGSRCRVTAGPFEGLEGIVVERSKPTRLVLQVNVLGKGASFDIDAELLEPVSEAEYSEFLTPDASQKMAGEFGDGVSALRRPRQPSSFLPG